MVTHKEEVLFQRLLKPLGKFFFGERYSLGNQRLLPHSIRLALGEAGDGCLRREELRSLVFGGFIDESIYLQAKILDKNREAQKTFLHSIVLFTKEGKSDDEFKELLLTNLDKTVIGEMKVKGAKLAQISRQGFDLWKEKFDQIAENSAEGKENVILIAYASLIGLRTFVKAYSKIEPPFYIFVPEWLENNNEALCGYNINPAKGSVEFMSKQSTFPKEMTLVDDTLRTGNSMNHVVNFLKKYGVLNPKQITIADASSTTPI